MVFDGTDRTTCPNYNELTDSLDMSYQAFMDPTTEDEKYGKEDFNKTCFNICATKNEDDTDKGPTYIINGRCNTCEPDDPNDDPNNPRSGTRSNLINAGLYQMCNVVGEGAEGSGSQMNNDIPTWFTTQQRLFNKRTCSS